MGLFFFKIVILPNIFVCSVFYILKLALKHYNYDL
jgi:hypothetical protein